MESMKSSYDVIVIGGGIVGSASALALLNQGYSVAIVDDSSPRTRASWGNAGHIAVEQTEPLASVATLLSAPKRLLSRDGALALPLRDIGAWLPFFARFIKAARPNAFARGKRALSALLRDAMPAWQRYVADSGVIPATIPI
jgi:D-amino-acid dehydrogenase